MTNSTIKQLETVFSVNLENSKLQQPVQRRRSIVREFSLNSSTHGVSRIVRSENIYNRVFWSVASLIFAAIMLYFIIESILAYFQYTTQISVSIVVEWPQAFPAVTICNYSPLRYDQFIGPFLNYTNALNITNTNDTTTFTELQSFYITQFLVYKLSRGEPLDDFFFPLSSMLIKCNFNGANCSAANFTSFISSEYGLCYTFNGKLKNISGGGIRNVGDGGGNGYLGLRLYVHSHQYLPYVSPAIGMVAMVHNNNEFPRVDPVAFQLAPGRQHKLSYTKQTSFFLPSPYTKCTNKVNLAMQAMFDQFPSIDYGYSQQTCIIVCIQTYTYDKCGCVNPFMWTIRSVVRPGTNTVINASLCDITNPCYSGAVIELLGASSTVASFCADCQQECSVFDFMIKSSSLSAPANYLLPSIKQFVESSSIPLPANWSTTWSSEIQTNYVALEVFCENTRVENYSEVATLDAVGVLSNVGGQTGLWMGISFLSLLEIVEMLYRLIRSQYHRIRENIRNNPLVHTENA